LRSLFSPPLKRFLGQLLDLNHNVIGNAGGSGTADQALLRHRVIHNASSPADISAFYLLLLPVP
jgi:hypothetical protein